MATRRLLIVDDDASFREVISFSLTEAGYTVDAVADGASALDLFRRRRHPEIITDLKMPVMDGMALVERVNTIAPGTPVIVITAFSEIETAVAAMKAGAFDFIPKPCDRDHLKIVVDRAFEHARLTVENAVLKRASASEGKEIIYRSAAMETVVGVADRIAESDSTVLITGESGTGKELIARRIHRRSSRADGPFIAVNCAAIPADLIESELFGHRKGAFTGAIRDAKGKFELAYGGTIFLDEVADLPPALQPRLLRVLQEKAIDVIGGEEPVPVDVRVIAATNRDLAKLVDEGRFRIDLFYRLNVIVLHLPPLRERIDDILPLAEHFLRLYAPHRSFTIDTAARQRLCNYRWPGNIRELENICQRIALLADGGVVPINLLPDETPTADSLTAVSAAGHIQLPPGGISLTEVERELIEQALEKSGGNKAQAARLLRIPRHVLLYRLEQYGITGKGQNEKG